MSAFATGSRFPVAFGYGPTVGAMWYPDGGIILLGCVDAVREMVISSYPIELSGWLVVVGSPVFSTIKTNLCTAIVAYNHAARVFRGYP